MKTAIRTMPELEADIAQAQLDRLAEVTHRAVFAGNVQHSYHLAVATVRAYRDVQQAEQDVMAERYQFRMAA